MAQKNRNPNFDQTLEILRAHSFEVKPYAGVRGAVLVSKHGAGAVLAAAETAEVAWNADGGLAGSAVFVERPGVLLGGEVARLLDRGYQKFIKTSQFELPASATQLQAVHLFSEELKQLTSEVSLYNEALGTTSDVYEYDRLKGREAEGSAAADPREPDRGR